MVCDNHIHFNVKKKTMFLDESDTLSSLLDSSDDDSDENEESVRIARSEDNDDEETTEDSVHRTDNRST